MHTLKCIESVRNAINTSKQLNVKMWDLIDSGANLELLHIWQSSVEAQLQPNLHYLLVEELFDELIKEPKVNVDYSPKWR